MCYKRDTRIGTLLIKSVHNTCKKDGCQLHVNGTNLEGKDKSGWHLRFYDKTEKAEWKTNIDLLLRRILEGTFKRKMGSLRCRNWETRYFELYKENMRLVCYKPKNNGKKKKIGALQIKSVDKKCEKTNCDLHVNGTNQDGDKTGWHLQIPEDNDQRAEWKTKIDLLLNYHAEPGTWECRRPSCGRSSHTAPKVCCCGSHTKFTPDTHSRTRRQRIKERYGRWKCPWYGAPSASKNCTGHSFRPRDVPLKCTKCEAPIRDDNWTRERRRRRRLIEYLADEIAALGTP